LAEEIKKNVPNATVSGTAGRQGKLQTEHEYEIYNQNWSKYKI